MSKGARSYGALVSILVIGLVSAFAASAGAATKAAKGKKDSGTAYISLVRTVGSTDYFAGYTVDKLFGQTATTYVAAVQTGTSGTVNVTARKVTLYAPTGSLSGTGTATENLATGTITGGKLNLTHGTGTLKGHKFKGTFTGTAKSGIFTFNYKGTLT